MLGLKGLPNCSEFFFAKKVSKVTVKTFVEAEVMS